MGHIFSKKKKKKIPWALHYTKTKFKEKGYKYFTFSCQNDP